VKEQEAWECSIVCLSWKTKLGGIRTLLPIHSHLLGSNNYCCVFVMTKPTIVGKLLQWQESPFFSRKFSSFFEEGGGGGGGGGYLDFCFLKVFFFQGWLLLCIPCGFEISLVLIVLTFSF
jgi:hypothetical protein